MAQTFKDTVDVADGNGPATITLNGNRGALYAGGGGKAGSVRLKDQAGTERVSVDAGGLISIRSETAGEVLTIDAGHGTLIYRDGAGNEILRFVSSRGTLDLGGPNQAGHLAVRDAAGKAAVTLDGESATLTAGADGQGGALKVLDADGGLMFHVTASFAHLRGGLVLGASNATGELAIMAPNGKPTIHASGLTAKMQLGNVGNPGDFALLDNEAKPVLEANGLTATLSVGGTGKAGHIALRDSAGAEVGRLSAAPSGLFLGKAGSPGEIVILNNAGQSSFSVDGGNGIVAVGLGNNRVVLDGSAGDIKLAGADCAEAFAPVAGASVEPGTVMMLADRGRLDVAREPYDRRVAGVVSGAGGVRPGIVLNRREPDDPAALPVALNGRVFCKVDATVTPIRIGDMLTTSPTPGHAMKAADPARAAGAVLGKAMGDLDAGTGLIPVLVSLM
jgi:hypothetical protein